ncbi:MAG: DedA family protein [Arachnia sp.]
MLHSWGAAIIATLFSLHGWPVYLLITGLGFAESAAFLGLLLPGETALFFGGVLAAQGKISLALLLVLAVVAAVAGDSVGYELGRYLGPSMRRSRVGRWIGPTRWDRAEEVITRRGARAVFIGRWVGVLRALVPAVAGASGMPYRRFLVANIAGGTLWAVTVVVLGFTAGAAWTRVQGWLGVISIAAAVLGAAWVGIEWARNRRRRSEQDTPSPADVPELAEASAR